jgi:hypothetical protein
VFACLRLRFKDPSMRFTFILFIAFMTAVVESGIVFDGKGEDREEVVVFFVSGSGCLVFIVCEFRGAAQSVCRLVAARDEIRCRCMLCCAACRYYRPPRVQGPVH